MNKKDLAVAVANDAGISNASAERAINSMLDTMTKCLKRGQDVRLVGFGTFTVRNTKARDGRNPRTGDPVKIKASKRPVFISGKTLKDSIN